MTTSNLTATEQSDYENYQAIISKCTYSFNHLEYEEISRIAASYEALQLLIPQATEGTQLSNVTLLLNHLNDSFYQFLETLDSN